jgi:LmbE family N-acetylglucosaminyl deacetylase
MLFRISSKASAWLLSTAVALIALPVVPCRSTPQMPDEEREAFRGLTNVTVLMDLSAHPDDEDGAMLALYGMGEGVATHSVFFTRGEGGQNEKGPELYEDLGVLRTAETEAAGEILGSRVHFLDLMDFGYSKTATETFASWGGEREVVRRLVLLIRKIKPDVLCTNHNTIDGHGHHQAVALTALAAFDAAGDSSMFPEQLRMEGVTLWQPRKLFFRVWDGGGGTHTVTNAVEPFLDHAARALHQHRTQGMDRADLRQLLAGKDSYVLMRQNSLYVPDSSSFFGGIDLWRDPALMPLTGLRDRLASLHPDMASDSLGEAIAWSLPQIDSLRGSLQRSPLAERVLAQWGSSLDRIEETSCGVHVRFHLADTILVVRQRVPCTLDVVSEQDVIGSVSPTFNLPRGWFVEERSDAAPDVGPRRFRKEYMLTVGEDAAPTLPRAVAQYNFPEERAPVEVLVRYVAGGRSMSKAARACYDVAPLQTLDVTPRIARVDPARPGHGIVLRYMVRNYAPRKTAGRVRVQLPPGWSGTGSTFIIPGEDGTATGEIVVTPPADVRPGSATLHVRTDYASADVDARIFSAAVAPGAMLGIVQSYDTTLALAAAELGVPRGFLTDDDIARGDLSRYTTIIVDIRAYLVRSAAAMYNAQLLDYVRGGGNLVVMYQREKEWRPGLAPLPFTIGERRVTMEDAPVTVLTPGHPLMTKPNVIGPSDWSGWRHERLVYAPENVASGYEKVLSCNDPDEPPVDTGLLLTSVGRGSYIYTSFVWYRELRAMVPGAYRCLANMISYPLVRR